MNPLTLEIPERIDTERLSIRAHRDELAVPVNEAVIESIAELKDWMPWARTAPSVAETLTFCRQAQAKFLLRETFHYIICLRNTDTVLGNCSAFSINWEIPKCEIGYWCRTSRSRMGFMTEGVGAVVEMLRQTLHMKRIEIRTDAKNVRSRALAERLSFPLEGILRKDVLDCNGQPRDTCVYALVV